MGLKVFIEGSNDPIDSSQLIHSDLTDQSLSVEADRASGRISFNDDAERRLQQAMEKQRIQSLSPRDRAVEKLGRGGRSTIGNIFERPQKAIAGGLRDFAEGGSFREGFGRGARFPEEEPSFEEEFTEKFGQSKVPNLVPGAPNLLDPGAQFRGLKQKFASDVGTSLDMATSPADMALMGLPGLSGLRGAVGKAARSKAMQSTIKTIDKGVDKAISLGKEAIKSLKIHTPKFDQSKSVTLQRLGSRVNRAMKAGFEAVRGPVGSTPIDPTDIDDIVVNIEGITPTQRVALLEDLQASFPQGKVTNVDQAYQTANILQKHIGPALTKRRGRVGKGGLTNVKISSIKAKDAVKDVIYEAVSKSAGENVAIKLRQLDRVADRKLFPIIEQIESVSGPTSKPLLAKSTNIRGLLSGKAELESQRVALEKSPKALARLQSISGTDVAGLSKDMDSFIKVVEGYKSREVTKKAAGALLGLGAVGFGLFNLARGRTVVTPEGIQTGP